MKKFAITRKWFVWFLLVALLAACKPAATPDLEMAATYAAQTLMAMTTPTDAETLGPADTATPTEEPTATATPVPTLEPVGPVDFPENINPLTGMPVEDPSILDRRPVFVKVANYPVSGRPHAGLSAADMVFEYFIGSGANRFMGLFYGQDTDQIGPVRSGRLVDPHIVSLYEGILGMESAYVTVLDHITDILGNRVISGRGSCPAICDDGRYIVTSVFANSEAMSEVAEQRGVVNQRYVLEGMAFDPKVPEGGAPGEQATILYAYFNRGEWRFDEESGKYLRWIEAESSSTEMTPLVDRVTDEQLAFANVVVIFANHTEITPTLHEIDIWNVVNQRAVVFRDGQAFEGTWTTPQTNQPIQFLDANGEVMRLKPGNTWVSIVGVYSDVATVDGNWTFTFRMP